MALNFPNSPVDGQIYYDTTSGAKYVWEAASSKWKSMQYTSTIVAFGYQTANAAYDTTNAAFAMANAAYNVQNVDFTLSNSAFFTANLAFDSANSNWAVQNAIYTLTNTSYASINSNWVVTNALYSVANSAFDAANNVGPQIAPTYNTANAAFAVANAALPNVSNAVFAGNLRVTGNLLIGMNTVTIRDNHIISAEYYRMNTANHMVAIPDGNRVNTIFSLVNVSFDTANASYNSANNVGPQIAPTYNTANAAYNQANAAYNGSNAGYTTANAAYNGSNAGYTTANAAFAFANTRFSSSGGTISGAVEITADLTVHGNTRFIDQQTLQVGDPLIYLAANNYTSDVVDIGFVANYVNSTSSNVHTGLFRSSGTKEYYLFQGYDKEPINNYIDPVGNNITMAVLNATVKTSNLILGGTNTINWITSVYGVANAVYAASNSNWTVTNTVYGVANAVYAASNSNWTVTNTVYSVANSAYGAANNVGPQIAPAYNTANASYGFANSAYASINSNWTVTNAIYGVANTALQNTNGTFAGNLTVTGNVIANKQITVTYTPASTVNSAIHIAAANTLGGVGYADFLKVINLSGGTNPNKTFRLNSIGALEIVNSAYSSTVFTFDDSGSLTLSASLGIGTAASGTAGEIRATNNITAYYSDERLKTIISTIQSPLEKVCQLSGVIYINNDVAESFGYTDKSEQVGLIAQQVEKVLPQIVKSAPFDTDYVNGVEVSKSGQNYKTVQYEKLIPLLVEAIKELKAEIDELRKS